MVEEMKTKSGIMVKENEKGTIRIYIPKGVSTYIYSEIGGDTVFLSDSSVTIYDIDEKKNIDILTERKMFRRHQTIVHKDKSTEKCHRYLTDSSMKNNKKVVL